MLFGFTAAIETETKDWFLDQLKKELDVCAERAGFKSRTALLEEHQLMPTIKKLATQRLTKPKFKEIYDNILLPFSTPEQQTKIADAFYNIYIESENFADRRRKKFFGIHKPTEKILEKTLHKLRSELKKDPNDIRNVDFYINDCVNQIHYLIDTNQYGRAVNCVNACLHGLDNYVTFSKGAIADDLHLIVRGNLLVLGFSASMSAKDRANSIYFYSRLILSFPDMNDNTTSLLYNFLFRSSCWRNADFFGIDKSDEKEKFTTLQIEYKAIGKTVELFNSIKNTGFRARNKASTLKNGIVPSVLHMRNYIGNDRGYYIEDFELILEMTKSNPTKGTIHLVVALLMSNVEKGVSKQNEDNAGLLLFAHQLMIKYSVSNMLCWLKFYKLAESIFDEADEAYAQITALARQESIYKALCCLREPYNVSKKKREIAKSHLGTERAPINDKNVMRLMEICIDDAPCLATAL